jgi:hypothetical protein
VKSKAILIGTMAILAIFMGTSAFSNSAYAQSIIYLACAAPPDQNPAPSDGTSLVYTVINNNNIDFTEVVADDVAGNARGWIPDGVLTIFRVTGVPFATSNSVIAVSTNDFSSWNVCGVNLVGQEFLEAANVTKSMNTTASQ